MLDGMCRSVLPCERPYVCIVTVDVVQEADKHFVGDVVEREHWHVGLGAQHFPLAEMVLQHGFKVVAPAAEKYLEHM